MWLPILHYFETTELSAPTDQCSVDDFVFWHFFVLNVMRHRRRDQYQTPIQHSFYFCYYSSPHTNKQMASGSSEPRILEQRRCLLLAAVGSTAETSPDNPTLKSLLNNGLLVTIKSWLDEILEGKVGGMDLLLHLLSNIIPIPVTKEMVTSSRLGKTVSSVEKHSLCVGSANESAIKSRIQQVKERWSASVKAMKNVSS